MWFSDLDFDHLPFSWSWLHKSAHPLVSVEAKMLSSRACCHRLVIWALNWSTDNRLHIHGFYSTYSWTKTGTNISIDYTSSSNISNLEGSIENVLSWSPWFLFFTCLSYLIRPTIPPKQSDTHTHTQRSRPINTHIHSEPDKIHTHN